MQWHLSSSAVGGDRHALQHDDYNRPELRYGFATPLCTGFPRPGVYNGQNVSYFPYHVPIQKISQYTLAVQRQFGSNLAVQVAYVGSHGFDLIGPE